MKKLKSQVIKQVIFLVILLVVFLLCGCAGLKGQCFEVGGTIKGNPITVKYCFAAEESKLVGLPVVKKAKTGEKSVLLTESQVAKINGGIVGIAAKKYNQDAGVKLSEFEKLKGFLGER